jgi:hypothetical protein
MQKHISYPKIGQFKDIIREVQTHAAYVGKDPEGNALYDHTRLAPIIEFVGRVKIHGTNAGICSNASGTWYQSRERIITPIQDNAGFVAFCEQRQATINRLISNATVTAYESIPDYDPSTHTLSIYGEFAGKGIQNGVAISNLPKSFYIFGLKVSHITDESVPAVWLSCEELRDHEYGIFNVSEFARYSVMIDFQNPGLSQNQLVALTEDVEKSCPAGCYFKADGIGEGIVWTGQGEYGNLRFKTKGEKHSASKVKTIAAVDTERLQSVADFVVYAATENRTRQAISVVLGDEAPTPQRTPDILRWAANDIMSEESQTLIDNGLEWKDVAQGVAKQIRAYYLTIVNEIPKTIL